MSSKQLHNDLNSISEIKIKKPKLECDGQTDSGNDIILTKFVEWCRKKGMFISKKVKVSATSRHRFGMMSTSPIMKSEVLFEVPRSMLLWEENYSTTIPDLESVESQSGWVKLLLVLMLEYTNIDSKWMPYLKFAPLPRTLDTPIFWEEDVRNQLFSGTSLYSLIESDIKNIENEYYNIVVPFIEKHKDVGFDKAKHTLELYKHMVGFLMAYSFTEPSEDLDENCPPKMVPMADVLNHISKNNAHLQFDVNSLKMVAVCDIPANCEVFNTYGHLSNAQLLQMYGYVEKSGQNKFDCVDIPIDYFKDTKNMSCLVRKWNYLFNETSGVLVGCDVITIGFKGILSCDEAELMFKVLCMSESEFQNYTGEDWESDSDSDSDSNSSSDSVQVISLDKISSARWKDIFVHACEKFHKELVDILKKKEALEFMDKQNELRKAKVISMIRDQISILQNVLRNCS